MKILILGGLGRLGGAFKRQLKGHEIFASSRSQVDVLNPESIERALLLYSPDFLINAAAYNNVDLAEGEENQKAMQINAQAPEIIAKLSAAHNIPLLHVSTDYVFAGDKKEGYIESDLPGPINVYGQSKFLGEQAVLKNHPRAYVVRTSRLYGAAAESTNGKRSFVDIVLGLAKESSSFAINGSEVSSPTLVDDLARHIYQYIIGKYAGGTRPTPGIYHMANSGGCTWQEWACEIVKILNLPVTVMIKDSSQMQRRTLRPAYSILLSTKLPAMRPWREALKDFLNCKQCLRKLLKPKSTG